MKKKVVYVLMIALVATTGCKKFLSVEPKFKFSDTQAINDIDGLNKTVTGIYSQLQSSNLYGGGMIANDELMADWVQTGAVADFSLNQLVSRQLNAYNSVSGGVWNDAYRAINMCNIVLANLSKFESTNPADVQLARGRCYFVRGLMHFELLRHFAQASGFTADDSHLGIPLRLDVGDAQNGQATPRSTVAQCYAQIASDLEQAAQILPASDPTYATKYAAQGILAKVYFTQHKYDKAIEWSEKVMDGTYKLNDSLPAVYSSGDGAANKEMLFQVMNLATDKDNGVLRSRFVDKASASTTLPLYTMFPGYFTQLLAAQQTVGDLRATVLFPKKFVKYYVCQKYSYNYDLNTPVLRYAEILLIHSESLIETGGSELQARSDYNLIRTRAGLLPDNTTSGKAALLAAVRQERDMELAMEGDRLFEVRRRQSQYVSAAGTFNWNEQRLIYPIPQGEVDANNNMVQNPGY
ncbi:MAG: RagB/SusD family nutrient uptake outer membrane protein [Chitinophagales bacterium]